MGLPSALDWWDEWKLRILVLCSQFVQFFLFFSGYVRTWYILRWLRAIVWLAYIGGDALAVYALATLFNRQKQQTTSAADGGGGGSSALEVIWAPVLLLHLGGQPSISAYSLEDNELWKRHAITLVSQVTVALYVFCKWWSGEKRLLHTAVMLFIVGILKFSYKPWALQRASYGSMISTYLSSPPRRGKEQSCSDRWSWLGRGCIEICTTNFGDILTQLEDKREGGVGEKGTNYCLEEYVKEAQEHVKGGRKENDKKARGVKLRDIYKLFLDVSAPYSVRLHYLQYFLNLDDEKQHSMVLEGIDFQFSAIYTKMRSRFTCLGLCTFLVVQCLVIASLALFAKSHKDGYSKSDITVTYILLFSTVVIEWGPFIMGIYCQCSFLCNLLSQPLLWQDMVAQHNIMSFCARNKKPPTLMKLATVSYLRHYINKHWYIQHHCVAKQISMLVRQHVEDGWKEYIHDRATFRRFNNLRGERTLMKHNLLVQDKLAWTFNLPFDEYVLLWHLATDLCIHQTTEVDASASTSPISRRRSSEIISNYMIYLLFICPDMLMFGTRSDLFMLACYDIECMINESSLSSPVETTSGIAQWIFDTEHSHECMTKAPRISRAYKLAKVLIGLNNHTEMWEVIQGVWLEMLCHSASRCRGYLHAKSLGLAEEFLTNVWLLWWFMGMQTLPDMMHNLESPEELTATAAV